MIKVLDNNSYISLPEDNASLEEPPPGLSEHASHLYLQLMQAIRQTNRRNSKRQRDGMIPSEANCVELRVIMECTREIEEKLRPLLSHNQIKILHGLQIRLTIEQRMRSVLNG